MPEEVQGDLIGHDQRVVAKELYPVRAGSVGLGSLPAGCTVLTMRTGLIGPHALVVVATDKGIFVAEAGKSKLTKLEPFDATAG